ncbi:MAG: CDP-diacylglycerol--glycerol-3-phosphate 3-phosphatidyltransferase [Candidatus Cloacimonetes bacterium]|nr:CDP-diacylglycerol--glycerol-3-phosphate 3-phosphatidyltransferase [Candidatus Cloacimonadota bacterium]
MKQIPNLLTWLRLLIIPIFLWKLFLSNYGYRIEICLALFVLAALTDFFDGYLARRLNAISDFGKIMDPLADKLIVLSALAGITWLPPYDLPKLVFFIILIREVAVTILREIYKRRKIIIPADQLGKVKTFMQMLGLIFALAFWKYIEIEDSAILPAIVRLWFWAVAGLTVYSGIGYFKPRKEPGEH